MSIDLTHKYVLEPIMSALATMKTEFADAGVSWARDEVDGGEVLTLLKDNAFSSGEQRLVRFFEAIWTGDGSRATLADFSSLSDIEAVFESLRRARRELNW